LGGLVEWRAHNGLLRLSAIQHCRETEVRNFDLELRLGEVYLSQESPLHGFGKLFELWLVREVKEDVGKFHVSVHDVEVSDIPYTLHELANDDTRLFLRDAASLLHETRQVKAVRVLLYHIDFV